MRHYFLSFTYMIMIMIKIEIKNFHFIHCIQSQLSLAKIIVIIYSKKVDNNSNKLHRL